MGPTKNGESRTIHPPADVVLALRRHLAAKVGAGPESPLFTGRNGERLRPGSYRRAWSKARTKCGLTAFHFHDLRHYAATQYASCGAGLQDLMYHFGWKSPTVAVRYLHASARRDAELAKSLPPLPGWNNDKATDLRKSA